MSNSAVRFLSRLGLLAVASFTTLSLAIPLASASPTSYLLSAAKYAVETASYDRPAHVVTATDISNAFANPALVDSDPMLEANLGELPGHPRMILFISNTTYKFTCVDFPNKINATPRILACPSNAVRMWQIAPDALIASRRAVAAAASHDLAVSGANVVAAAAAQNMTLEKKPTFKAGQGGKVEFAVKSTTGTSTVTLDICVLFPKTAYGIPAEVNC